MITNEARRIFKGAMTSVLRPPNFGLSTGVTVTRRILVSSQMKAINKLMEMNGLQLIFGHVSQPTMPKMKIPRQ